MMDIIIRNGQVYDGTGNPWTKLDVGIQNGRIVKLGKLADVEARVNIDVKGLVVSPGFIDTHVHSDLLCTKPEVHKIKALQGVTSELLGQDGISVAPVSEDTKPLWQKQLKGLNGDIGPWPWNTIEEYFSYLEQSNLVGNVSYLVPHGAVRALVMGFDGRPSSPEEMIEMRQLVEEGMKQGAVGVSSGLVYPPNVFSNKEELIQICRGAAAFDGCFVVHMRNESHNILEALDEVIDVARQSGVRLHISHFKVIGLRNRDKFELALEKIDQGRNEGIEITFDQYPYPAASTVFHAILPPWMHSGGTDELLNWLKDPLIREKIKQDFETNLDYENWVYSCGWKNIIISSVSTDKNKSFEGKSVAEIAELKCSNPEDTAFDLLVEENAGITMVVYWGQEEDVMYGMKNPVQIVGSDGIFGGKPHPRLYGTFPRVLGRYAREKGALSMAEAIRHMTGAPAQLMRLKDRGFVREGYYADLTIFDPEKVIDTATYDQPLQEPVGIQYVIINGKVVVENSCYTGVTEGMVIRRAE